MGNCCDKTQNKDKDFNLDQIVSFGERNVKEVKEEKVELSAEEVEGISHNPENVSAKKELNLYSQKGKNNTINRIFNTLNK